MRDRLEVIAGRLVLGQYSVLVRRDALSVGITSQLVELALSRFLVSQILLVPSHHSVVFISSIFDLVGELAMLVCDPDLLLQAYLLIVKFAEAIFQHLSLRLKIWESLIKDKNSICKVYAYLNLLLLQLKSLLELAGAI